MMELKITYDPTTGDVNVTGPLPQKGLIYLMLELAKDVVREWNEKAKSAIVHPSQVAIIKRD